MQLSKEHKTNCEDNYIKKIQKDEKGIKVYLANPVYGEMKYLSIGFKVKNFIYKNGIRFISRLKIHHISLVANPAQKGTEVYEEYL